MSWNLLCRCLALRDGGYNNGFDKEETWGAYVARLQSLANATPSTTAFTQQLDNKGGSGGTVVSLSADDLVRLVRAASATEPWCAIMMVGRWLWYSS